ncbi:MAG TPA: FtsX-like permease family protein [Acidimicrobiales bacterium]|nr:FtsX-like permease family protein [Acidimicrobiales bacterium]
MTSFTSSTSLRLAARLARREVRRRPWRTLLVALLVALPVAGMTVAAGFVRTDRYDPVDMWQATWGASADVGIVSMAKNAVPGDYQGPDTDAALASLPAGSRVTSWRNAHALMRTVDKQRSSAEVSDIPLAQPIGADYMQLHRGRFPTAANEVFLTRKLADDFGVDVGDTVDLERPQRLSWKVTGIGERRAYWGSYTAVVGPGSAFPWDGGGAISTAVNYAVDVPDGVTRQQLRPIVNSFGKEALAPHLRPTTEGAESKNREVAWSWVIGGIVLTVVGIVIASAFAAGARRQLTTLGQLAANGAAPAVLRSVLFLQGTWTGLIGAVLGVGLGGVGLLALAPHADRLLGRDVEPWDLRVTDLVPVVFLGVLAATLAALIPARTTIRVPVLAALAGRRPLVKVPRFVTGMGAVTMLGGLGLLGLAVLGGRDASHDTELWALTAVLGGMGVLLGACAMTPGYVSVLEPVAMRLSGAWRLAARSLARQRTRTSAVVAGVCAASALAVGASAMFLSVEAEDDGYQWQMRADQVHVLAERTSQSGPTSNPLFTSEPAPAPRDLVETLRGGLPGSEVSDLRTMRPPKGYLWNLDAPDAARESDGGVGTFNFGPGSNAATVFDGAAAQVYGLGSEHRAQLEKEGMLVLGDVEAQGELSFLEEPEFEGGRGGSVKVFGRADSSTPTPTSTRPVHPVAVVDGRQYQLGLLPRLLVVPAAAARAGLVERAPVTVIRMPKPLTREQLTTVRDTSNDYHLDTSSLDARADQLSVYVETRFPDDSLNPLLLEALLSGTALLFSLFVVAVSLALAAAETRDERDVLTVVGAPPKTMWGTSGRKAVFLTALGGVLAVPVGFLPVVVFNLASNPTPPLVFPWRVVLLLLVAVPALAGLATTMGSAVALRMRPVRISTMAFD